MSEADATSHDGFGSWITHKFPFLLHMLVELPASSAFLFTAADPLIIQYAVLLFVSVLIAGIFVRRDVDTTSRQVAAALAIYHLSPVVRATSRLLAGQTTCRVNDLGGPRVHLCVHAVCLVALLQLALGELYNKESRKIEEPIRQDK